MADSDGVIDRAEFLTLCMIRIGAANPHLIKLILSYFDELDTNKSGGLTKDELLQASGASGSGAEILKRKLMDQSNQLEANEVSPAEGPTTLSTNADPAMSPVKVAPIPNDTKVSYDSVVIV